MWRDVPDRYGPWWRVYALFACWQVLGVWERIESALIGAADAQGKLSWQVPLSLVVAERHPQVVQEPQHLDPMAVQP